MQTIQIFKDYKNQPRSKMYASLMKANETEYCIIYPKEFHFGKGQNYIFPDYMLASYVGQKLYEIAKNFTYNVPSINTKAPFQFHITITDIEQFAEVLFYIACKNLYDNDNIDIYDDFIQDATIWCDKIEEPEIEVACYGLYHLASQEE